MNFTLPRLSSTSETPFTSDSHRQKCTDSDQERKLFTHSDARLPRKGFKPGHSCVKATLLTPPRRNCFGSQRRRGPECRHNSEVCYHAEAVKPLQSCLLLSRRMSVLLPRRMPALLTRRMRVLQSRRMHVLGSRRIIHGASATSSSTRGASTTSSATRGVSPTSSLTKGAGASGPATEGTSATSSPATQRHAATP